MNQHYPWTHLNHQLQYLVPCTVFTVGNTKWPANYCFCRKDLGRDLRVQKRPIVRVCCFCVVTRVYCVNQFLFFPARRTLRWCEFVWAHVRVLLGAGSFSLYLWRSQNDQLDSLDCTEVLLLMKASIRMLIAAESSSCYLAINMSGGVRVTNLLVIQP